MDTVSGNKKVMDKWTDIISESSLFKGVEKNETAAMIKCLDVRFEKVDKGQYVLHDGDTVERIGMVIEGEVSIEQEDYWGNRHIMAYAKAGDIFGEAYACSNNKVCNVSVVAMKAGTIAYLDTYRVITVCSESCQFHNKLIRNLMYMLADRCVNMNEKLHICQKGRQGIRFYHIFHRSLTEVAVMSSIFHLTDSSLQIICQSTAVLCHLSWGGCRRKGLLYIRKIILSCYNC